MLDTTSTGKTRFMEPTLTRASERSRARGKREGRAAPASSRAAARLGERRPSQRPLKAPLRRGRGRLGRLVLVAAVLDLARAAALAAVEARVDAALADDVVVAARRGERVVAPAAVQIDVVADGLHNVVAVVGVDVELVAGDARAVVVGRERDLSRLSRRLGRGRRGRRHGQIRR